MKVQVSKEREAEVKDDHLWLPYSFGKVLVMFILTELADWD
jgi:hypothetical protein